MTPTFDPDELMDRIDGDIEFLEETIEMLDEDAAPLLEQIRTAVAAGDAPALVAPAHTIKGMLSNFAAETAEGTARDLEIRGREDQIDGAGALLDALNEQITALRADLQAFLNENRQ